MSVFEFFSAPRGTPGNAVLNWSNYTANDIIAFAWSYQRAAMGLVLSLEGRPLSSVDEGALPIMFLYRHAFELYLKAIVYRAAVLTINQHELQNALPRLWREHSLMRLAKMAEPAMHPDGMRPLVKAGELHQKVFAMAAKIDEIDPASYSFRYPIASSGKSALPQNLLTNISIFSEAMESVLVDVAQFCRCLEDERLRTSAQMKIALHPILNRSS